uniref:Uncharacterized protein n=1 Tax=Caenorhabditis japonica TaxID=281687 RepID=A0A8R1IL59_CAEJA
MKTTAKPKEEKEPENLFSTWQPRPLKGLGSAYAVTSADADGEQGWLPLQLEPLRFNRRVVADTDIALRDALQHLNLGEKPPQIEYQAPEEPVQIPERDPITTGEEAFEMPDFTSTGYWQIIDGNSPLEWFRRLM